MRVLLGLAVALVLLVVVCSATLRLASNGVGCTPWPDCYAQAHIAAPLPDDAVPLWQQTLRLTHRISATVAGLVFVFIVTFGFGRWSASQRVAGVSLWVLALALALIGRVTPSELPAVVLANLLGGHLLLAALAWLLVPAPVPPGTAGPVRWLGWPLFVAVLLALASGGLVSARGAVTACSDGCGVAQWPAALAAWHLWQPDGAWPAGGAAALRGGLLSMHIAWGVLVIAALALAAWRLRRQAGAGAAALAAGLALAAAVLGLGAVQQTMPLPAAVAHSVLGGLTLAAAAMLWRAVARAGAHR